MNSAKVSTFKSNSKLTKLNLSALFVKPHLYLNISLIVFSAQSGHVLLQDKYQNSDWYHVGPS